MCGILGLFQSNGQGLNFDQSVLDSALSRLKQRGPDDEGQWSDGAVWMGHRRLSVLDLSSAGHQPMLSADGRFAIVFNGEIYNHLDVRKALGNDVSWRGHSDTETLLAAYRAWGPKCLSRFNGMFALAIWDRNEKTLFLARDRLGVKPLYYSWNCGRLIFASRPTAAAVLLDPKDRGYDPQALRSYLELGFIPAPYSMYRSLRKLPPAHYMLCSADGIRAVRYWDYRHIAPENKRVNDDELVDELQELVKSAVQDRMISDVPLGAFLSSGVDSSLVAAAMSNVGGAKRLAFNISFTDPRFDEGPGAAKIARHLGMELVTERLGSDDLLKLLPEYIRQADEPMADSSGIATMALARLARRHVTVALTGDGGDELFAGYPHYRNAALLNSLARWPQPVRDALRAVSAAVPMHDAKLLSGALRRPDAVGLFHYLRSIGKDFSLPLQAGLLESTTGSLDQFEQSAASFALDLAPMEIGMRLDMGYTLPDLYLQKVDVATMSVGLEARNPLLDYRLVEWAVRLPLQYKFAGGCSKYLLKKLLTRYLPEEMVYRPKQGFSVPIGHWLRGPLREWALERLNDSAVTQQLPLDWQRVRTLFEMQMSGTRQSYPILWAILMLVSFVAEHGDLDRAQPSLRVAA